MSNPESVARRKTAPVPADQCGLVYASALMGDRWSLLILREAFYGVTRFDDLQADLGAPRQALADRLTRLVAAGVLARRAYREPGQRARHDYVLTDSGRALAPAFVALMQWGEAQAGLAPALMLIDAETGAPVSPAFVDAESRLVPASRVGVVVRKTGEQL